MIFDSIVVGAGIEGSATAYQFAKKGYNTLLLEQVSIKLVLRKCIWGQLRNTYSPPPRTAHTKHVWCRPTFL